MPLENFPLLKDNTRLIRYQDSLYKVKVRYDSDSFHGIKVKFTQADAHTEIEQVFRAVLYMDERGQSLKPIITTHFTITPKKVPWSFPKKYSKYQFRQNGKILRAFPYVFEFEISRRQCLNEHQAGLGTASDVDVKNDNQKDKDSESEGNERTPGGNKKGGVVAVKDSSEIQAPKFGRTKDGRLYRLVNKDAVVMVKSKDESAQSAGNDTKYADTHQTMNRSPGLRRKAEDSAKSTKEAALAAREAKAVEVIVKKSLDDVPKRKSRPLLNQDTLFSPRITRQHKLKSNKFKKRSDKYHLRIQSVRPSYVSGELTETEKKIYTRHSTRKKSEGAIQKDDVESDESQDSQTESDEHNKVVVGVRTKQLNKRLKKEIHLSQEDRSSDIEDKQGSRDETEMKESQSSCMSGAETSESENKRQRTRRGSRYIPKENSQSLSTESETDSQQSQDKAGSRAQKHKLYKSNQSPLVIQASSGAGTGRSGVVQSPQVSTVKPVKRDNSGQPKVTQPPATLQPRSQDTADERRVTRRSHHDSEMERIAGLHSDQPAMAYREILLNTGPDRHTVEQAEREETNKLRQLYEPTVPRRSPRKAKNQVQSGQGTVTRRRSSGLWGTVMDNLITPTKNLMRWK